jgi:nicotinamidase-related amidase
MEVIWDINPEKDDGMRTQSENAAAIIIDIQERLFPHIHEHDTIAANTVVLIKGLKVLGIPVHVTQQYSKGLGRTIPAIEGLFTSFRHIEKTAFSCCDEPEMIKALEADQRQFIIIAGIESHVCVLQTVIDLIEKGFMPVVIEDCVSSRKPKDKNTAMKRIHFEGAIVSTCESVLFELCRFSGTEEFKAISKLVK